MITEKDIQIIEEIKDILNDTMIDGDSGKVDWSNFTKIDVLDKVVRNLKIAKDSYRPASSDDIQHGFYTVECKKCGWWGSSRLLDGGGQIADTGDYDDGYCPVCGNNDIDEKE